MRRCNTAGPCVARRHTTLPALARLPGFEDLVAPSGRAIALPRA